MLMECESPFVYILDAVFIYRVFSSDHIENWVKRIRSSFNEPALALKHQALSSRDKVTKEDTFLDRLNVVQLIRRPSQSIKVLYFSLWQGCFPSPYELGCSERASLARKWSPPPRMGIKEAQTSVPQYKLKKPGT